MHIVVLGGAGLMGPGIVRDLTSNSDVERITVADLDAAGAHRVVNAIGASNAQAAPVDVRDPDSIDPLLHDADACVNAVQYYLNLDVMHACLRTGTHYVDLGGLFYVTRQQMELSGEFEDAGITAVLGLGSSPGVSNIAAACAAAGMEHVERIYLYNAADIVVDDPLSQTYSIQTILDEITKNPIVFENGEFTEAEPLSGQELFHFRPPVGLRKVHHSLHSELATLPLSYRDKGVQEVFFKIAFFGYSEEALGTLKLLTDLGLGSHELLAVRDVEVRPRDVLMALQRRHAEQQDAGNDTGSKKRAHKNVTAVVHGRRDDEPVTVRVDVMAPPREEWSMSGSQLMVTSPPAIGAVWLAEGCIDRPGVHAPEIAVPAREFFAALGERGVETTITYTEPL